MLPGKVMGDKKALQTLKASTTNNQSSPLKVDCIDLARS